ncbi:MAG: oligopeptide/dipeptide transporter, ATPase subunit [Frankiales bacterium]|nr:oligopeptide/dipeptide transporter, ATPase subunit [Frankiales bacterium]
MSETTATSTAPPEAGSATGATEPVARVSGLSVTFTRAGKAIHAIRGVDLAIRPGEILGLVGESGSGKSVLGSALLGLLPGRPDTEGSVIVRGSDMLHGSASSHRAVRRLDLGAVFQDPMTSLNPTMKVGKQVEEAAGSSAEAERLLAAVGIPDPRRRMASFPHELSGGLRQRVMIAMAVAGNPALVIADEPTTALDVTVQAQVLSLLRKLRDEIGCSFLLVTHDLGVAAQIADRIAVMYAGRLAELGPTRQVLTEAAHPYTLGLMRSRLSMSVDKSKPLLALAGDVPSPADPLPGCAFAPRCAVAVEDCATTLPELLNVAPEHGSACIRSVATVQVEIAKSETIRIAAAEQAHREAMAAAPVAAVTSPAGPETDLSGAAPDESKPVLLLQDVTKTFAVGSGWRRGRSGLRALRRVSLTIEPGESVALVGESGSGKSTLLRVIAGLESRDGGSLTLNAPGRPQMVFQDAGASLTPWLSVGELISERLKGQQLSRSEKRERVLAALAGVGLPAEVARARSAQLSGGQRQRVSLARATVIPPALLLCDEPTSALDVSLAASVINLIGDLRRQLNMSVLFVTHDLSVARVVADRIAVMYLGRIVELGDADEVTSRPAHPYTQSLVASIPDMGRQAPPLKGEPASPLRPPDGCAFHPRCPLAIDACSQPSLDVRLAARPGSTRLVACTETKVI